MDISVIILNKDKPELIENCLKSIFENTKNIQFEVLVGDTGSQEFIFSAIYKVFERKFPDQFKYFEIGKYQFSANNNAVAKKARGKQLLFLNNDTLLLDNSLKKISDLLASNTSLGAIGPKLLFGYNQKIQHAGIEFFNHHIFGILGYHPLAGKHSSLADSNLVKIVPAVTGACVLVNRSDFELVGGFDEAYHSEAQDVDLCLKIFSLGKKIVYDGTTAIIHLENGSRPLGEENKKDRRLLEKKWGRLIKTEYLKKPFQFQLLDSDQQSRFANSKKILFERIKARGDVLASLRLCKMIKVKDPNCHITFKTEFADLVDSSPFVDRVLSIGEMDTWNYDQRLFPSYEDGTWKNSNSKWIEQMATSIGLESQIPDEPMKLNFSEYDKLVAQATMHGLPERYIVVGTGAGWPEREWSPHQWEALASELAKVGYSIVQIGGESDYQISGAYLRLNKNLQTNYLIVNQAKGAIMLDSFPLHVTMMTDKPTIVLTCKTCGSTVWFRSQVKEMRNIWAVKTPLNHCRELGCRLKYGNGLDNPCATPILKDLEAKHVMILAQKHFKLGEDAFVAH